METLRAVAEYFGQQFGQHLVSHTVSFSGTFLNPTPTYDAPEYVLYHMARDVVDEAAPIANTAPYTLSHEDKVRTVIERTMNAELEQGTVRLTNGLFPALTLIGDHRSQLHGSVMVTYAEKPPNKHRDIHNGVNVLMAWLGLNNLLGATMQTMVDELQPYQDGGFRDLDRLMWALRHHMLSVLPQLCTTDRPDAPWEWHRPLIRETLRPLLTDRDALRARMQQEVPSVYERFTQ